MSCSEDFRKRIIEYRKERYRLKETKEVLGVFAYQLYVNRRKNTERKFKSKSSQTAI